MYHTHTQARRAHDEALAPVRSRLQACERLKMYLVAIFFVMGALAGLRDNALSWGLTATEFWTEITIAGMSLLAALALQFLSYVIVDRQLKLAGMPSNYQCTGCDDCARGVMPSS